MKNYDTFKMAERFGINKVAACRVRARYLIESIQVYLDDGSDLALLWAWECVDELLYLFKQAGFTELPKEDKRANQVTEEMKQRALDYPVLSLIDFSAQNKAIAWCHNDKSPSLVYFKKNNKVWCPVCNKAFNSVDILMNQEGCDYYTAVRRLCQ